MAKTLLAGTKVAANMLPQIKAVLDPFDRTTMQPKLPDGKIGTSVGLKYTICREHYNVGAGNIMHAILFPGQSGGLYVIGCQNFNSVARSSPEYTDAGGFSYAHDGVNDMQTLQARENYHSWRIVSQGVRFELLNPAEQDDGWWEAVRLTDILSVFDYRIEQHDNGTGRTNSFFAPFWLLSNYQTRSLSDESTYESGRLKDIHTRQFHLHQVKDEVDFTQLCSPISTEGGVETGLGAVPNPFVVDFNGAGGANAGERYGMQNYNAIRNYIDFGYDAIYFRFHCRDPATPTRLLTHVVSNQEIQFAQQSGESRFETQNTRLVNMESILAARNKGGTTASVPATGKKNPYH